MKLQITAPHEELAEMESPGDLIFLFEQWLADAVPLRYQFEREFPGTCGWEYLEQGPEEFRVKITNFAAIPASVRK